jgi:hypothetical protein
MLLPPSPQAPPPPGWRWAALLGFALIGPISLPAGGAERRQPELRRRLSGEPFLAETRADLKASPSCRAPALATVMGDEPLRILRGWQGCRGERWLLVETGAGPAPAERRRRGWMLVESPG